MSYRPVVQYMGEMQIIPYIHTVHTHNSNDHRG